jgi:hypothetical protein
MANDKTPARAAGAKKSPIEKPVMTTKSHSRKTIRVPTIFQRLRAERR